MAAGTLLGTRGLNHAGIDIPWLSPGRYALTQFRVVPVYLRLILWPAGQSVAWDVHPSDGLLDPPSTLGGALLLGAIVAAAITTERWTRDTDSVLARVTRLAAFGASWFLLWLAPTSTVIPLSDLLMEHRVYIASLGVLLPLGAGVAAVIARPGRARLLAGAALAAILLALALATYSRSVVWATELALWTDATRESPRMARVHLNLGNALHDDGRVEEALREYRIAQDLSSDHTISPLQLLLNVSAALLDARRPREAAAVLEEAARAAEPAPEVLNNLAIAYLAQARLDDAEVLVARLLAEHPSFARAHNALGLLRQARGDYRGARDAFAEAVRLAPADILALTNLARVEEALGHTPEACAALARAAELSPAVVGESARLGCDGR